MRGPVNKNSATPQKFWREATIYNATNENSGKKYNVPDNTIIQF